MPSLDIDPDNDPTYTEPAIPPGVSADTAFSIQAQARQHHERMGEARATRRALGSRLDKIDKRIDAIPGKIEVRAAMMIAVALFTFLLVGVAQLAGINSSQAATDSRRLLTPLSAPEAP